MRSIFSEKVPGAEGWGAGYYAEGARGSTGQNSQLGDRTKVELSLAKAFALRGDNVASTALLRIVKGRSARTIEEEDVE